MICEIEINKINKIVSIILSVLLAVVLVLIILSYEYLNRPIWKVGIVIVFVVWFTMFQSVSSKYSKIYIYENYLYEHKLFSKRKIFFNSLGSICVVKNYIYGRFGGFYDCSFEPKVTKHHVILEKKFFYKVCLNLSTICCSKHTFETLENTYNLKSYFKKDIVAEIDYSEELINILLNNKGMPFFMNMDTYIDISKNTVTFTKCKASFCQTDSNKYIVKIS